MNRTGFENQMTSQEPEGNKEQRTDRIAPVTKRVLVSVVVVSLMFGSFIVGNISGYLVRPVLAQGETPTEFAVFWEAWELVETYFVDQENIDYTRMTYGAIQGMLDSLGDENHTVFFAPEVAAQQESSLDGSFEGIGAYVSLDEGVFTIVAPIHGSPAEKAGILAGDIVLAVNDVEITGMPEWEVISMIRGPADSIVTLTVLHPEETDVVEIDITRGRIDIESVVWSRIPGTDLVHLQITQFASDTSRELQQALTEIHEQEEQGLPVSGIMLDLRNNLGGYLQEALRVGSHFLPEGEIILHEKDAEANMTTYRSQGRGLGREIPLVVLINPGSASAAEILSGALQENGRAKLVGEPTVGTGTVLRPFTLSDGSVIRLGVTNWLTPEENLIKGQGIQPDVTIEQGASVEMISSLVLEELDSTEVRTHEDRQFQAALLLLNLLSKPLETQVTVPNPVP